MVSHLQNTIGSAVKIQSLNPNNKGGGENKADYSFTDVRNQLREALQTTLVLEEICQIFFDSLQLLVSIDSFEFSYVSDLAHIRLGTTASHSCNYDLILEGQQLGMVTFSRQAPFNEQELARIEALIGSAIYPIRNSLMYLEALKTAMLDPLTGVGSRSAMESSLDRDLGLAQRHQQPFSILLVDIDRFKNINDTLGHSGGDAVLRSVAGTINNATRETDQTFRFGGEEFLVILEKTGAHEAEVIAERIRKAIENLSTPFRNSRVQVTASFGLATVVPSDSRESLFERADKALYSAKQQGRNRVVNSDLQEAVAE